MMVMIVTKLGSFFSEKKQHHNINKNSYEITNNNK